MANEINVRKATSEDTETLVRLMEEFYAEANYRLDKQWAADSYRRLFLEDHYGCAWIVSIGERTNRPRGAHCAIHNGTWRFERLC